MNVLGVHYGHNATVCLIQDGVVTFAQSEERLNRIKNSTGFPSLTLKHVYDEIVPPERIDRALLFQEATAGYLHLKRRNFQPTSFSHDVTPESIASAGRIPRIVNDARWRARAARDSWRGSGSSLAREMLAYFRGELSLPSEKVAYVRHHDAHALSAVPNLARGGRCLLLTLDGSGDGECATAQVWEDGRLTALSRDSDRNSLGFYYAYTTALLGMRASEHEFKVMGLAPYAPADRVETLTAELRKLLSVDEAGHWRSRVHGLAIAATLERLYRLQRFDVVAGAIQRLTEELVVQWVRHWVEKTGCRRVGVGGGVFMNVKAAQLVAELDCVDELFVVPSAGDESCAVGAAVRAHLDIAPDVPLEPLADLYLGVDVRADDVRRVVTDSGVAERYDIRPADHDEVADLLAAGEVVARCAGRMEYGARALGNRSILADPSRWPTVEHINSMIKNRDFWMPFAPSILESDVDRYIEPSHATFAPYMTITFPTTPLAREHLAAAVHPRDKTARPQVVVRDWNPAYYDLIERFRARTGIGALLNTSFNLHGEPNVCSADDAIRTVDRSGLRHLVLGDVLLTKREPTTR